LDYHIKNQDSVTKRKRITLMQKIITLLMLLTISLSTFAQTEQPQMADAMRSNGKIYVVVVVCLLILIGLIGYVLRIDRKLTKLEQKKD